MHIADMHFNHRTGNGRDGISEGNRSMGITTGVQDNAIH